MDRTALLAKEFREFREAAELRFNQIEAKLRERTYPVEPAPIAIDADKPQDPAESSK
jgi:hypothetical protein